MKTNVKNAQKTATQLYVCASFEYFYVQIQINFGVEMHDLRTGTTKMLKFLSVQTPKTRKKVYIYIYICVCVCVCVCV